MSTASEVPNVLTVSNLRRQIEPREAALQLPAFVESDAWFVAGTNKQTML